MNNDMKLFHTVQQCNILFSSARDEGIFLWDISFFPLVFYKFILKKLICNYLPEIIADFFSISSI